MMFMISSIFPASLQAGAAYAAESDTRNAHKLIVSSEQEDDKVRLSVSIKDNVPQLDSLQFELAYDSSTFTLTEVKNKELIGSNSVFSDKKSENPYFCSWYVGSGAKPENGEGVLAEFIFEISADAKDSNYTFAVNSAEGFYNITESTSGQVSEKKVQISDAQSELTLQKGTVATLYTFDEAKALLETEAEKTISITESEKEKALEAYDEAKYGFSKEAAKFVLDNHCKSAKDDTEYLLASLIQELTLAEDTYQETSEGGKAVHDISDMLLSLQAQRKSESDFMDILTEDALKAAEINLSDSLDGKRIIEVSTDTELLNYFNASSGKETIYFSFETDSVGAYGIDVLYDSKSVYEENNAKVIFDKLYRKVGKFYRKMNSEIVKATDSLSDGYLSRQCAAVYENDDLNKLLRKGETYVFAITVSDGFRPESIKLKNFDYAEGKVTADANGNLIDYPHTVGNSSTEKEFLSIESVISDTIYVLPHDGYAFDGLYAGDKKIETEINTEESFVCYTFYDADGKEIERKKDFWLFGSDIYFKNEDGEMKARLSTEELEAAGLTSIEFVGSATECCFGLEELKTELGAASYAIKKRVTAVKISTGVNYLSSGSGNTLLAKFSKVVCGDVTESGNVDFVDALYLKRHLAGWSGYTAVKKNLADVNGDDKINSGDLMILEHHLAGYSGYEILPYKTENK